jgi:hypothetical protein
MAIKIKVQHMAISADNYLYVIDVHDHMWKRHLPEGKWQPAGNLPDEPNSID